MLIKIAWIGSSEREIVENSGRELSENQRGKETGAWLTCRDPKWGLRGSRRRWECHTRRANIRRRELSRPRARIPRCPPATATRPSFFLLLRRFLLRSLSRPCLSWQPRTITDSTRKRRPSNREISSSRNDSPGRTSQLRFVNRTPRHMLYRCLATNKLCVLREDRVTDSNAESHPPPCLLQCRKQPPRTFRPCHGLFRISVK